jgi:succinoglycan biosynthesis transport protein ExoP
MGEVNMEGYEKTREKMKDEEKIRQIDLMNYWRIIVRRKWIAISFASAVILFTGISVYLATPLYRSSVTLLVEDDASKVLSVDEAFGSGTRFMQDYRNFNTQLRLIRSKSLAERVAKKINMIARPGSGAEMKARPSLISGIKYIVTLKWISAKKNPDDKISAPPVQSNPYSGLARAIRASISVSPVRDTKLVEVSYVSPNPALATEIINTLAEEFINFSVEQRFSTTQLATDFYTEQINRLQEEITARERELQRYGQEKDIGFLSDTDSAAVNTFARLSDAYNEAMLERINAEAELRELRDLEGGSLPQLISDPTIQQLKAQYVTLRADYDEKSRRMGPEHPEMLQIKARLDTLKNEIDKAADAAEAKVRAARQKESTIKSQMDRQKSDVAKMKNNAILYNSIKSEVDSKRTLLGTLLEKRSQTQISAQLKGLEASNISIVDRAEVPRRPFSPNKTGNLLMALIFGLFGGVGLCFLFDFLDDTVKGPEDVEKLAGLPSLGVVPYLPPEGMKKSKRYGFYLKYRYSYRTENPEKEHTLPEVKEVELINHLYPHFPISEDYRTVRTSILLSQAEKPPKTIMFTSAMTQEGKTATVVNMAISFAQLQERVLVVETDLRKPRLHRLFKVRNLSGLTAYLTGKVSIKDIIQKTFIDNIWLIPCGPVPPNPVELLNSSKMKNMLEEVGQVFDIVLLDSPPMLAVIDPVIISSITDSVVLVLRGGKTRRKPFLAAVEELRKARTNILGVVFNAADLSKEGSYYTKYYHYHKYGLYGEDRETPTQDHI